MSSLKSHILLRSISTSVLVLLFLLNINAQEDPNPNSPEPILLSDNDSTRALAVPVGKTSRTQKSRLASQAFFPDQKVEIFVTNVELTEGEGANAFRIYIE